ncbi:hypothetical protein YC2023_041973 [Brassica napus]
MENMIPSQKIRMWFFVFHPSVIHAEISKMINATREAGGVDQREVDHSLIVQINMIVFLIHVLAHDPDFPSEDCMDEHVYARFCGPMLSVLLSNKETVLILFSILRAIKRAEDACKTPLSLTW